ncbi:MAG: protein kinase domain-containing protein, partial [Xenococcaceae cyanobacterium]
KLKTVRQKYCTSCGMPLILVDRYIPVKLLGKGGFGRAFLARDRYTPTVRECVVKQFQPSLNLSDRELEIAQQLFEREATVLEQLGNKHEQIPDLYAYFPLVVPSQIKNREEQFFYLAQEYIDGQNLEEELNSQGNFSEAKIIQILQEILPVLQFVHENHSIHRDIKPSNIIRSQKGLLYLVDFGAVKQVTAAGENQQASSTGIYSQGFAPPEQKSGARVFPSTDLYALAVTCICLLTGKPPEDLYDTYNSTWQWQSHAANVSDRTSAILDRMLLSIPRDRFQSAQEVIAALQSKATFSTTTASIPIPTTAPTSKSSPTSALPATVTSNPPAPSPSNPPVRKPRYRPSFSLIELFGNAAFTGFEAALLYTALVSGLSLLNVSLGVSVGLWGAIVGGLIFAQYRRVIEKVDLLIIAGITLGLIYWLPFLRGSLEFTLIAGTAVLVGTAAIATITIFRLIYNLLSRLF